TSHLATLREDAAMDHVEERILDRVVRLHPEAFAKLAEFCARHEDYLDATIARFDREVQFYLAYLEMIGASERRGSRSATHACRCAPRSSPRERRSTSRWRTS